MIVPFGALGTRDNPGCLTNSLSAFKSYFRGHLLCEAFSSYYWEPLFSAAMDIGTYVNYNTSWPYE